MLNFSLKGTYQDPSGYSWDYYRDDQLDPNPDPNAFYIIPKPQFVTDGQGNPSFGILCYQTDGSDNGSGFCRFDVELSVPQNVQAAIAAAIKANPGKFPGVSNPTFLTLALNQQSKAGFNLIVDGQTNTFFASASNFGSNVASFQVAMTKHQIDTFTATFSKTGGAIDITYYLSVPARLQGVSAKLSFDSSIAFQYQVTQPTYNSWGDQTSPGSVQKMLNESASSKVEITWGIANPSNDLKTDVTNWANNTLSDLVTAEVQKTIQLQGLQSGNSFNINEVSSFTANYAENMVINWLIQPTAALPTFPDMQLNIGKFESTVNEQQQQMTVATNLPFYADSQAQADIVPKVTAGGVSNPAYIDSVSITVVYPGLPEAEASYTFNKNESQTFTAPYNATAGATWGLKYTVNYHDPNMGVVSGEVDSITTGVFNLKVEQAGILTVQFDASNVFVAQGQTVVPQEIDIAFTYINAAEPLSKSIQQVFKIKSTDKPQTALVSSLQPMPVSTGYNYQITYIFPGGVSYVAPLVQNQNGFNQLLVAANVIHSCGLTVYVAAADASTNPVFDATVQMWYEQPPTLPPGFPTNQPTKDSPAVFTITPNPDSTGNLFGRATFEGLLSGDQPLMYSASIDAASGQVDIDAQPVQNTQASIMVTPTQRYFTIEIDPAAVNWSTADFASVEVLLTPSIAQGTAPGTQGTGNKPQQACTWNKGETGNKFLTYPIQDGNTVSYACTVNYISGGNKTKTVKLSGLSDVIFNIPATADATAEQFSTEQYVIE
jgi:hypothetical protein